jgi:ketosteroid isomerase-like protein
VSDADGTGSPAGMIGDAVPAVLDELWDHLAAGRSAEAAACFAAHGLHADGLGLGDETAPRVVAIGPAQIAARLGAHGVCGRWSPALCVRDGSVVLVEGTFSSAEHPVQTAVCGARLSTDGSIDRYVMFSCRGARDPIPTDVPVMRSPADASAVVDDYFARLDTGDFVGAAARFSTDVLYSHPPYRHTGIEDPDRVEFRGRAALEDAFNARGKASFDHEVVALAQRGPHCLFEGAVNNLPGGGSGSFISSLSLAADGRIRRYVSFYCEPGVPRS